MKNELKFLFFILSFLFIEMTAFSRQTVETFKRVDYDLSDSEFRTEMLKIAYEYEGAEIEKLKRIFDVENNFILSHKNGTAVNAWKSQDLIEEEHQKIIKEYGATSYGKGATLFRNYKTNEAMEIWTELSKVSPEKEQLTSARIAYMLGRGKLPLAWQDNITGEKSSPLFYNRAALRGAISYFQKTREIIASGFPDKYQYLVMDSLGWEAYANLQLGETEKALRLYLQQLALEDYSGNFFSKGTENWYFFNAATSINDVVNSTKNIDAKKWIEYSKNELERRIISLLLISTYSGVTENLVWTEILNDTGVINEKEAAEFSWVAYNAKQFSIAEKWVAMAPENNARANIIRSKFALRKGDFHTAEKLLENAANSGQISGTFRRKILAELADLKMGFSDYIGAMETRIQRSLEKYRQQRALGFYYRFDGRLNDIVECTLTSDELIEWLKKNPVDIKNIDSKMGSYEWNGVKYNDKIESHENEKMALAHIHYNLRYLLARKLMRERRYDEAVSFFPEIIIKNWIGARVPIRKTAEEFIILERKGDDISLSKDIRALAYRDAAKIVQMDGSLIKGSDTNIFADFFNATTMKMISEAREKNYNPMTEDEIARILRHRAKEFLWSDNVYEFSKLAWKAIDLMPNNTDETAQYILDAGLWLWRMGKDHADYDKLKESDKFYKALVRRCRKTEIGRVADEVRWFPRERHFEAAKKKQKDRKIAMTVFIPTIGVILLGFVLVKTNVISWRRKRKITEKNDE